MVEPVETKLIQWPESARVDRVIPKERLYAKASVSSALKQRFVDEVKQVRWAYKLGEESLRLAPGPTVTEIQIFVIELKGSSLDNSIVASIDKAIPSQIIFELHRNDGTCVEGAMTAAYKRAGGMAKGADYFRTGWIASDQSRLPLPAALDMDNLYTQLLGRMLPYPIRPGETLSGARDRMGRIRVLTREIAALEKKLRGEPQLNRKIELRRQIKERTGVLTELTDSAPSKKE